MKVDLHLAKRHFDSAAETHPDAKWPSQIGLLSLKLAYYFSTAPHKNQHAVDSTSVREKEQPARDSSATRPSITSQKESSGTQPRRGARGKTRRVSAESWAWMDELMAFDTLVLISLSGFLLLVLQLRYHQREVDRRLQQEGTGDLIVVGGGEGQPLEE